MHSDAFINYVTARDPCGGRVAFKCKINTSSFSLPHGGHFGFMGENNVETSNRCQIWNPRGRFTLKGHLVHDSRCSGSKLDFSRWRRRPFLDFGLWRKMLAFLRGTWRLILF